MSGNSIVEALLSVFEKPNPKAKEGHRLPVSRTVSTFAVLYEKARNAVEFRAEHLVRRAAIERIFKRLTTLESNPNSIAENLTVELLWAKYIDSSLIDDATMNLLSQLIEKYLIVKKTLFSNGSPKYHHISWDTIAGIASAEIDEMIITPVKREAVLNFAYQMLQPKVKIPEIDSASLNLYVYIGIERSFAQSDDALITFHLLKVLYPEWLTATPADVQDKISTCIVHIQHIKEALVAPPVSIISKYLRKQLPPFLLLRDFLFEHEQDCKEIIDNPTKFEETLTLLAEERYRQIGQKVRRGVIRSIIYIFLTKMILALALETPVDLFLIKRIDYIPLFINLLFPPFLLFLLASFISIPGSDNTKKLVERVKFIIYDPESFYAKADALTEVQRRKPLLSAIFSVFYLFTFVISFGGIIFILTKLHFNPASQIIFVFFVALVSLFAYRIRQSAREYEVIDRQGIIEPIIDFFFLPILYAGDLLSKEIAKINFFIFLFDFILEAPIKVIFEVIEEWIHFIRTKKEEII